MKIRLLGVILLAAALWGCEADRYPANDFVLITAYRARAVCTCLFVMEMDEEYCDAYAVQDPPVATHTVDWERKVVESQALLLWGDRAHYVSEHFGCVYD